MISTSCSLDRKSRVMEAQRERERWGERDQYSQVYGALILHRDQQQLHAREWVRMWTHGHGESHRIGQR